MVDNGNIDASIVCSKQSDTQWCQDTSVRVIEWTVGIVRERCECVPTKPPNKLDAYSEDMKGLGPNLRRFGKKSQAPRNIPEAARFCADSAPNPAKSWRGRLFTASSHVALTSLDELGVEGEEVSEHCPSPSPLGGG